MADGSGGATLGQAKGIVTIEAQLQQAGAQIAQFSQQTEQHFARVAATTKQTESSLNNLANVGRNLAAAFGINFGVQTIAQMVKGAIAADELATAYNRQMVAAVSLAGSQAELNELLDAYDQATGGAIDKATALADVTRLQAIGFADSAAELQRFAEAARGAAIATGQSQEFIVSQLQLAIANQSTLRLDQLGLGVTEVKDRIAELRAENENLTEEMAYQEGILGLLNEKFGDIARSSEASVTGIEKLGKAWKDLGLEIGQALQGPLDAFGKGAALLIDIQTARLRAWMAELDVYIRLLRQMGMAGPWLTSTERAFVGGSASRDVGRHATRAREDVAPIDIAERDKIIEKWFDATQAVEERAADQRLDATRQYESQRTRLIENYEEQVVDAAAAFAKQRVRAEEDYAKAVADVHEEAARRDARMAADHARNIESIQREHGKRLADMQEQLDDTLASRRSDHANKLADMAEELADNEADRRDSHAKRLADINEDYMRQREQAERSYARTLTENAADLDAKAIWSEQQRFEEEQKEAEEAHAEKVADEQEKLNEAIKNLNEAYQEKLADEQEALGKSIAQAQEAYAEQLEDENEAFDERIGDANEAYARQLADAREADARRLSDMAEHFAEVKRREDEDHQARMGEMATDHDEDLAQLDSEHNERLTQISEQAAADRQRLGEEFEKELANAGIYHGNMESEQEAHQNRMMAAYQQYLDDLEREEINSQIRRAKLRKQDPNLTPEEQTALDNFITKMLMELGEVGQGGRHLPIGPTIPTITYPGEPMISTAGIAAMPAPVLQAPGATSIVLAAGAVTVYGAPGQSVQALADIIDQRILRAVRVAVGRG